MIQPALDYPVSSKDRQGDAFPVRLINVPVLGARAIQVVAANRKRIELWIFNNWPNYGVFIGPAGMLIPAAASGVPSDLGSARGSFGWPLAGFEKLTTTTYRGELFVASNLAVGSTAALVIVELSE